MVHRPLLLGLALFATCATASDRQEALRSYDQALRHEIAREYKDARAQFEASLASARAAGLGLNFESAATYNLARMVGYTCDFEQANELLLESLKLERSVPRPNPGNLTKRISELGRLAFDRGLFSESADYYKQVLPELERLGVLRADPVGFAVFLEDYALAASRSGNETAAQLARTRSASIRWENPGRSAQFVPVHYREVCPPSKNSNRSANADTLAAGAARIGAGAHLQP